MVKHLGVLVAALASTGFFSPTPGHARPLPVSLNEAQSRNIQALMDKGTYWYERFRFDLAQQQFNRVLLIDPTHAPALRWQGLNDLAKGDVQAAQVWLERLKGLHGPSNAFTIELAQAIELGGSKRQRLAELRFLAESEQAPPDVHLRLDQLLGSAPLGEAAVQIYPLMARTEAGRALARERVVRLAQRFPEDKRYRSLLASLGGTSEPVPTPSQIAAQQASPVPRAARATPATPAPAVVPLPTPSDPAPPEVLESSPVLSNFERGQNLADAAAKRLESKELMPAYALYQEAIALNPDYPWFRFDYAVALDQEGNATRRSQAEAVMQEGLNIAPTPEMRFAAALLAARQNRGGEALALIDAVPREQWTDGMSALERRVSLGFHVDRLNADAQAGRFNTLAKRIESDPRWLAEPAVQSYTAELNARKQRRVHLSFENSDIDGTEGISRTRNTEIPLQIDLPLDFERTLFLRMDTLRSNAGRVDLANANNFGQVGTRPAGTPAAGAGSLNQDFRGAVLGVGVETENFRADLGTTAGNLPVNSWVGGLQWRLSLGGGASLRVDVARRMVSGSTLASTGAIDPITGEAWGGARRNGASAVYYTPIGEQSAFVGIARANLITGKNLPDNTELNLQGILSRTVWQAPGQNVEVAASLFTWSFDKNLGQYTFGQGGYYSPQAFASLSFPITWTGTRGEWSWQARARLGASVSKLDDAELYPGRPDLAAAAQAQGNPILGGGGNGGGSSRGLRLAIERRITPQLAMGGFYELDRSEGYNPDLLQVYLRYSLDGLVNLNSPPSGISPYSRF